MGGKTWQTEEERFFWKIVIPRSPEGLNPYESTLSWGECADLMSQHLGHHRHRLYNKQLLYEHFYQNCRSERPSPRARLYVREYLAERGPVPVERPGSIKRAPHLQANNAASTAGSSPKKAEEVRIGRKGCSLIDTQTPSESRNTGHDVKLRPTSSASPCIPPQPEPSGLSKDVARPEPLAKISTGRRPLPADGSDQTSTSSKAHMASTHPKRHLTPQSFSRIPRFLPCSSRVSGRSILNGTPLIDSRVNSKSASVPSTTEAASPGATTEDKSRDPEPREGHGSMFEALLQATNASSSEVSPVDTRSGSVSSSNTTVGEECARTMPGGTKPQ